MIEGTYWIVKHFMIQESRFNGTVEWKSGMVEWTGMVEWNSGTVELTYNTLGRMRTLLLQQFTRFLQSA